MAPARILIADPDEDSRTVYRIMLEHSGFEVRSCAGSEESLRLAHEWHPHVVILELTLPPDDGFATIERLRSDTSLTQIPVVVLTARALASEEKKAREAGCAQFLTKPLQPQRLVEAVRQLLQ